MPSPSLKQPQTEPSPGQFRVRELPAGATLDSVSVSRFSLLIMVSLPDDHTLAFEFQPPFGLSLRHEGFAPQPQGAALRAIQVSFDSELLAATKAEAYAVPLPSGLRSLQFLRENGAVAVEVIAAATYLNNEPRRLATLW